MQSVMTNDREYKAPRDPHPDDMLAEIEALLSVNGYRLSDESRIELVRTVKGEATL